MIRNSSLMVLILCFVAACSRTAHDPAAGPVEATVPSSTATSDVPSGWLGRWTGPEGTYLEIVESGGKYKVAIRNLDGVRTFDAAVIDGRLTFERDGTKETITAGSGRDTGMKWLQDKTNCLIVRSGEGYCRA